MSLYGLPALHAPCANLEGSLAVFPIYPYSVTAEVGSLAVVSESSEVDYAALAAQVDEELLRLTGHKPIGGIVTRSCVEHLPGVDGADVVTGVRSEHVGNYLVESEGSARDIPLHWNPAGIPYAADSIPYGSVGSLCWANRLPRNVNGQICGSIPTARAVISERATLAFRTGRTDTTSRDQGYMDRWGRYYVLDSGVSAIVPASA